MILRSLSHWGAFRAEVANGRLLRVEPFEHDPEPRELISVWPEMVASQMRVAKPAVRRGWLAGDGGIGRGDDRFVEVGWEEALDLAAGEIRRIRAEFGNASGAITNFDILALSAKGSLYATRPTLGTYVAKRADLLANANELFDMVGKRIRRSARP